MGWYDDDGIGWGDMMMMHDGMVMMGYLIRMSIQTKTNSHHW